MTWYNNSWSYRKPVTISNSGSALTNYQVLVTVDTASLVTAGKLLSNYNDIRFTSSDGSTIINYWIESGCNTSSTKIWVKVPSIAASPTTTTIYMYYKNAGASAASSGTGTFDFYDDFSSNSNGWSSTGGIGVSGGRLGGTYGLNGYHSGISRSIGDNWVFYFDFIYVSSSNQSNGGRVGFASSINDTSSISDCIDTDLYCNSGTSPVNLNLHVAKGGNIYYAYGTTINLSLNTQYYMKWIFNSSSGTTLYVYSDAARTSLFGSVTISAANLPTVSALTNFISAVWGGGINGSGVSWSDNWRIAKYASTPPTVSSPGTEEAMPCNTPSANLVVLEIVSSQLLRQYPSYIDIYAISRLIEMRNL